MIAVDTNVLVYAHREDSEFHAPAHECLDTLRHRPAAWAVPWPCIHEFIGIATHPRIYDPPSTLAEALGFLDALLAAASLQLLGESQGYFEKLRVLATAAKIKGPRIHDARV